MKSFLWTVAGIHCALLMIAFAGAGIGAGIIAVALLNPWPLLLLPIGISLAVVMGAVTTHCLDESSRFR